MLGTKEVLGISVISILMAATLAYSSNDGENLYEGYGGSYGNLPPFDRRIQYLIEAKRSVNGIKNLIDELHSKLEKRTACMLDGGLSASCNHKDAVEAGEHHRFLASSFAPGRRKRDLKQPSMEPSVFSK
ncbi:hypothetical protein RUM43_010348 [Polyplax serrata]|uniref:Uncharacterized protein n=1 Tax=Polyplax serrata TaxID=468196 RepID=A0AAN8S770_POLSC